MRKRPFFAEAIFSYAFFFQRRCHRTATSKSLFFFCNFCLVFAIEFQMPLIKLKSSDGEVVMADVEVAKCSGTIRDMLENGMVGEDDEEEEAPIPKVKGSILRKVLEWAEYHKNDKAEDEDEKKEIKADDIPEWDAKYLMVDHSTLFDIILAANYLNIKGLLVVAAKSLSLMLKGQTAEEIRTKFNIPNDFTEEEKEEMRKEIEWCEEKK